MPPYEQFKRKAYSSLQARLLECVGDNGVGALSREEEWGQACGGTLSSLPRHTTSRCSPVGPLAR
jgi:hypothetical protein